MIKTLPKQDAFRTAPTFGVERVDRTRNVIFGASIIQSGDLNDDRPWEVDTEALEQVVQLGNRPNKGTKARVTHPNMSNDGFGTHLGRWKNFRLDGDTVRADLHIADAAFDTPKGDLASYVLDLAEEDPEAFGVSIATRLDEGAMDELEEDGRTKLRVSSLRAADIVDEPAATRGGLFSAEDFDKEDIPAAVTWLLDTHFQGATPEVILGRFESLLSKYYETKGVDMPSEELQVDEPQVTPAVDESHVDSPEVEEPEASEPAELSEETPVEPTEGARFLEAFGDQGGVWFAQGKSFSEAQVLFNKSLQDENDKLRAEVEQLRAKVDAASFGEEELSGGSEVKPPSPHRQKVKELEPQIGKSGAEFAAFFDRKVTN